MKKTLVFCLLIIGLVVTGIGSSYIQVNANNENPIQFVMSFEKKYYTPEFLGSNMSIQSDQDLIDYGFPGVGSELDPYRIENYTILAAAYQTGLSIKNTTKYILVQNCTINALSDGMSISRIAVGTIRVYNNSFVSNGRMGIFTSYAPELIINDNYFYNNYLGINFISTTDVQITNNTFIENQDGVRSEGNATRGIISHNVFYNNSIGISLENAPHSQIMNNAFRDNFVGIVLFSTNPDDASNYCNINNNLIEDSESYGILITAFFEQSFTKYNVIHHNTLINNNATGISQAKDHGTDNIWYDEDTRQGNFWSDWWGVGDYKIAGKAGSKDKYPLSSPIHEVTAILPTFLKGRVILYSSVIPVAVLGVASIYLIIRRRKK